MSSLKILATALAAATFSLAFAQGTPPRPAANPAIGAGQRSTENTPMGETGTPGGRIRAQGGTSASGTAAATAGSAGTMGTMNSGTMNSGTMNSGTTARAQSGTTTMAADTHTHTHKAKRKSKRIAKADRN